MSGVGDFVQGVFGGGPDIPSLDPARQVELLEFGEQIAPTQIPTTFGGQRIAEAFQSGAQLQGQALQDAIAEQQRGLTGAQQLFGQTEAQFDPFVSGAGASFQRQAALSGALGPQAQQEAISSIEVSPGQQFLRDRAQRALQRTAAARGDLGGGRTAQALQEQAIGFGMQDLQNEFNRLGQVTAQGSPFASQLGALRSGLGQAGLGVSANIANALAQQGQVGAQGQLGAAQALGDEAVRQFGAGQDQFGQLAQQQAAQQQFGLGQQQIDLQNIANQLGVDRANANIAAQNQANQMAGLGNVIGLGGSLLGFGLGGGFGSFGAPTPQSTFTRLPLG